MECDEDRVIKIMSEISRYRMALEAICKVNSLDSIKEIAHMALDFEFVEE